MALSLGYAALVGVGGAMGYMKSGNQKSLAAGGFSAAVLYYVYTQLPTNPVFASSVGLGISAALLGVMGSRFKRSEKSSLPVSYRLCPLCFVERHGVI
ncbi:Protein FATTY ACID EXPORT 2 [Hibiscus syriacus]|uniref:Protein FATTY ACID EXPORT 2 n=1 Tax=Hibiscus syriacus TaxID=106335 RepID=A0A6A2X862_HIBSY|nr:Protein FATTY ACID EXPORT 2 [Hibiscus syriacus]